MPQLLTRTAGSGCHLEQQQVLLRLHRRWLEQLQSVAGNGVAAERDGAHGDAGPHEDAEGAALAYPRGAPVLRSQPLGAHLLHRLHHGGQQQHLVSLTLRGNAIADLAPLAAATCLVHLDLSHNHVSDCGTHHLWSALPRLSILLLHSNRIASSDAMSSLAAAASLRYLSMRRNPLCNGAGFRASVLAHCRMLAAIDTQMVHDLEMLEAAVLRDDQSWRNSDGNSNHEPGDQQRNTFQMAHERYQVPALLFHALVRPLAARAAAHAAHSIHSSLCSDPAKHIARCQAVSAARSLAASLDVSVRLLEGTQKARSAVCILTRAARRWLWWRATERGIIRLQVSV